jgi:hypothetical protein
LYTLNVLYVPENGAIERKIRQRMDYGIKEYSVRKIKDEHTDNTWERDVIGQHFQN